MRKARIYNDCTGKYIEFDYDKVEEIDNKPLTEEDLKAIKEFKERVRKFENDYNENRN